MLRIRFHGRGGQGMKTASRILGAAAFHAGYVVQDAPVYGAERRGAPMAAFTRLARAPILERGAIVQADLVVVADDTLLTEPAAQPLAGCASHCTVLVNSTRNEAALRQITSHDGRLLVVDGTALALDLTHTLAGLSTAMGVAAAHLVGLPLAASLAGLTEELDAAHLDQTLRHANLQLAQATYARVCAWEPIQEDGRETVVPGTPLVEVLFDPPQRATPSIYAHANSPARQTGSWRQFRPVLHPERCTAAGSALCAVQKRRLLWTAMTLLSWIMMCARAACCVYTSAQHTPSALKRKGADAPCADTVAPRRSDDARKAPHGQRCRSLGRAAGRCGLHSGLSHYTADRDD